MDYVAIARKWRPHDFAEVIGQEAVIQTLKNAILHNRVAHAYLFSGARGTGKTSIARIFAKTLRCPNAKDAVACQVCEECQLISESRSVDVIEIDGASNNGVESVRSLRENVAYGASTGRYKIYIIDEVHMLSISAFNALLKTLEEPPEHVIFIFVTTELAKIPLTILSRCQRFEFRRHTQGQILACLKRILTDEKVSISEEGLRLIASHADGSMRDSQSLLDQVLSFYSDHPEKVLEEKDIVEALGINDTSTIRRFVGSLIEKEIPTLLEIIQESYGSGVDLKNFSERCLEEVRLLYLITLSKVTSQKVTPEDLDMGPSHFELWEKLAQKASVIQLERTAQILSKTIHDLNWSSLPRFVLEMAAVKICHLDQLEKIEAALLNNHAPEIETEEILEAPEPKKFKTSTIVPQQNTTPAVSSSQKPWESLVETVMKKRPLLGALLSHANFKIDMAQGIKTVQLAFEKESFYEKQALDPDYRRGIEQQVKEFFGDKTVVVINNELKNTNHSLEAVKQAKISAIKKEAVEHPAVIHAKEVLGAELVGVHVE